MTIETDVKILQLLDEWKDKEGGLPLSLTLYRRLLQIQLDARSQISSPAGRLGEETIRSRIEAGQPLFSFPDLSIDWPIFYRVYDQAYSICGDYPEIFGLFPHSLNDPEAIKSAAEAWYCGKYPEMCREHSGVSLLLLQTAFKPFLRANNEALSDKVEQDRWRRSYCLFCGGRPDFSFLDKERGSRFLLCSRCDSEWLFQRMECPACGNQDQNSLAYFVDDSGLYRLYVCEKCKSYLKTIDLRCTENQVWLPLERFFTLDLDAQACKKGYQSLTGPAGLSSDPID